MSPAKRVCQSVAASIVVAMAAAACAGNSAPDTEPTPYVHELARLQQGGWLDQSRLRCVIVAAAPLAVEVRTSSRTLRDLRDTRAASEGQDHARSVQHGMAGSDEADHAARAAVEARQMARQAALAGDNTDAAHYAGYASQFLVPARDTDGLRHLTRPSAQRGMGLSDGEADLFVEYAELRALLASADARADVAPQVREIEARSPVVMDIYAGLLLELYGDEELVCAG